MQTIEKITQDNRHLIVQGESIRTLTLHNGSQVTQRSYKKARGKWVCFKRTALKVQ